MHIASLSELLFWGDWNAFNCALDLALVWKPGTFTLQSTVLPMHIASLSELLFWGAELDHDDIPSLWRNQIRRLVDRLLFNKQKSVPILQRFFIPSIGLMISNFVYPSFPNYKEIFFPTGRLVE